MASRIWMGIAAVAAAAGALIAAPAQARTSVYLNIGTPFAYAQPGYVYAPPAVAYSQPSYVYSQPSYVYAQPTYVVGPRYRPYRGYGWRDSDHDGVPNRFDRRPHNPYRY